MSPQREALTTLLDRSRALWDRGDVEGALACCQRALFLEPLNVDALANTGTLMWLQGDVGAAEDLWLKAHSLDPGHAGVALNIATLRNETDELEASLDWIRKAEALHPGDAEVRWRKALVELALGDYQSGWQNYEAGLGHAAIRGKGPGFKTARWAGAPCRRLLLWHEQGLGDTLQFVRYAELCKERADKVYVLCPKELTALVKTCRFVDDAVDSIGGGDFDEHISIMSLPHLFRTRLDTIPAAVPYLYADREMAARWAPRMRSDKLKVGLVWAANFRKDQPRFHVIDRSRSLPLAAMHAWLDLPNAAFYSLQKGNPAREAEGTTVIDYMNEVRDLAGTAALIENLDLVISVDTSVVHVAGAMGKPVWVLSRIDACWRWLRNRPDSPWYPTARVFGQTVRGDWQDVIRRVWTELARM